MAFAAIPIATLNKQVLGYFGRALEELKNWRMTDAVRPDDIPRVLTALEPSIRGGTRYEIERRCWRADGVYRWFIRAEPNDGPGGTFSFSIPGGPKGVAFI